MPKTRRQEKHLFPVIGSIYEKTKGSRQLFLSFLVAPVLLIGMLTLSARLPENSYDVNGHENRASRRWRLAPANSKLPSQPGARKNPSLVHWIGAQGPWVGLETRVTRFGFRLFAKS
ncbi:hypothetical protein CRG98_003015 [Punica granatum]|uniref:Uncharacterized protein n=1 Tax=Punica granatum TaxID=22663 RepID=A0A2I0L9A0_PUNGR|nr:hypothetical protein CRG98_003015 [Punica granatum]